MNTLKKIRLAILLAIILDMVLNTGAFQVLIGAWAALYFYDIWKTLKPDSDL